MAFQAFIGSIVQRGVESAIDSLLSGKDHRQAGRARVFGPPEPSRAFGGGDDDNVQKALLEQFVSDEQPHQEPPPSFLGDPLLAKLASGEPIRPTDFLKL